MTGSERKRGRPSEAESQVIDDLVIDTAFTIFRTEGYEATRMDRVATAAGITKMSLYRRFAGKADLLAAVIRQHVDRLIVDTAALRLPDAPVEGLRALMWAYRQRIGADGMLALQRLALTAVPEECVRQAMIEMRARYVAPVDALIEIAKSRNLFLALPTDEIREILFDLLVNDAAAIPLHGYPSAGDQRRIFLQRWTVVENGLLRTGAAADVGG